MIDDTGMLIIIHPMAFARFSPWRCSAVNDIVIGEIKAPPMPFNEKKRSMVLKLVEKAHVAADKALKRRPVINKRLWLNLTLNAPTMKDAIRAINELAALI